MQRASQEILRVREKLESGDSETHEKFTMYKARVYRITKGRWRLYLPAELRYDIVSEAHKTLCHMGIDKTLAAVKEAYYFPKMRDFVSRYIGRCINCIYYKTPTGKPEGYLHPYDKGSRTFEVVHVDPAGPFICTERGNNYVIAAIDGYSKYCVLRATQSAGTREAIEFIKDFVNSYNRPVKIITDRGVAFTSCDFEKLCAELNIQHVKIASATPRANGQIEQLNRVIKNGLATVTNKEGDDWDEKLLDVQWAINNSEHRVTKRTPFEIVFHHRSRGVANNPLTAEIIKLNEELNVEDEKEPVETLLAKNRDIQKRQFDKGRREAKEFKEGDLVMVRSEAPATGRSRKLEPKYRGPYEVVNALDEDRYLIQDIEGEQQSSRIYKGILAADRLKAVPLDS